MKKLPLNLKVTLNLNLNTVFMLRLRNYPNGSVVTGMWNKLCLHAFYCSSLYRCISLCPVTCFSEETIVTKLMN